MELLRLINNQIDATKFPLFAITIAAVPCPNTPIVLTLHWHAFIREKVVDMPEAQPVRFTPVPSSALQVNTRWDDVAELDQATLDAGWQLGAWDVARAERRAAGRPGADSRDALECLQAFGAFPFGIHGQAAVVSDTPDADELLNVAATRGYLMWMFRPVIGGIWKQVANDITLNQNGGRELPCPIAPTPARWDTSRKTVYLFGINSDDRLLG